MLWPIPQAGGCGPGLPKNVAVCSVLMVKGATLCECLRQYATIYGFRFGFRFCGNDQIAA